MSLEVRLPLCSQLSSDIDLNGLKDVGSYEEADALIGNAVSDRVEIGNLGLALKALLVDRPGVFSLSGGVGVLLPTASDVDFRGVIPNETFTVDGEDYFVDLAFDTQAANETVDITPFLGYTFIPTKSIFFSGLSSNRHSRQLVFGSFVHY